MAIELYVFPPSPRAFKVMVTANHLSINPTLHLLDLRKGEQKAADYTALNPNQRMPTLRDREHVVWESEAILPRDHALARDTRSASRLAADAASGTRHNGEGGVSGRESSTRSPVRT